MPNSPQPGCSEARSSHRFISHVVILVAQDAHSLNSGHNQHQRIHIPPIPCLPACLPTLIDSSIVSFVDLFRETRPAPLLSLPRSRVLAISAVHLLCASGFLARLARDGALCLLDCALDLVLEGGLPLVVGCWYALLCHACACGFLGSYDFGCGFGGGGRLALALGGG